MFGYYTKAASKLISITVGDCGPRNQLNRHEEIARFWRPFRLLDISQHRGQIPSQLNMELAGLRHQDDRIDQPTQNLSGFPARVWPLQRGGLEPIT